MIARRRLILAGLGALLAPTGARASGPPPKVLSPEIARAIRSVGVISAVGDEALIWRFGMPSVLFDKRTQLKIADWNLDSIVEAEVRARLPEQIAVKATAHNPQAFQPKITDNLVHIEHWPDLGKLTKALLPKDVDVYLTVTQAPGMLGPYPVRGMGMFHQRSMLGLRSRPFVFASYEMAVLQATTGTLLARRQVEAPSPLNPARDTLPTLEADEADFAVSADDFTDVQKSTFRANAEQLLKRAVDRTLQKIGLPAAG